MADKRREMFVMDGTVLVNPYLAVMRERRF